MVASNPDTPPADELTRAFRLPDYIRADTELSQLYEAIVARLRSEALGLPMNMVQTLLIERIASSYVILKYREDHNEFPHPNAHKDATNQWLDMTREFNKLLLSGQAQMRSELLLQIETALKDTLKLVEDTPTRQTLRRAIGEKFAEIGL